MRRLTFTWARSNIFMIATPSYCSCRRSYITSSRNNHYDIIINFIQQISVFQWSETLCSNFNCSWNPCLFGGTPEAQRAEIRDRRLRAAPWASLPPPHQLEGLGECCKLPRPQIHFGPTKSLENASSGRKCRTQFNFLLSTEPLNTTGRTPVEKHCNRSTIS